MKSNGRSITYFDIFLAKKTYNEGRNVIQFLKDRMPAETSLSDIIEISYDLQAGEYIENVKSNKAQALAYWEEMASIIDAHADSPSSWLDVGSGELTTLTGVLNTLRKEILPNSVFALDISWSRLKKGLAYVTKNKTFDIDIKAFVADIRAIPLPTDSIDMVTSSHALEPNGRMLDALLRELFRVAKRRLILFEPCYEINSAEGKARMDEHGYVKGIDQAVSKLGGTVKQKIVMENVSNPLNPTVCFVVDILQTSIENKEMKPVFTVPGTDISLEWIDHFYFSKEVGLSFPILAGIPILRDKYGIVSTAMLD